MIPPLSCEDLLRECGIPPPPQVLYISGALERLPNSLRHAICALLPNRRETCWD